MLRLGSLCRTSFHLPKTIIQRSQLRHVTQPIRKNKFRVYSLSTFGTLVALYAFQKTFPTELLKPYALLLEGTIRLVRTCYHFAVIALDYHWNGINHTVHQRCAERMLRLFNKNGGIYIKAGQFLASMNTVLPDEYMHVLKVLQDAAPWVDISEVEKVILEEFGKPVDELFQEFATVPFAAASVAQVHKAVTKDGTPVAVKIQYPKVRNYFEGDVLTHEVISWFIATFYKGWDFAWLAPELKRVLIKELDFTLEAENSRKTKRHLKHRSDAYIPEVISHLSTKRVLTMEFIDGVKANDLKGIKALGLSPKTVAASLIDICAEQIYVHGFLHGDPHPGNILIRKLPNGKPQIVLLDHGLYTQLSEEFRKSYCYIWKAMVLKDDEQLKIHAEKLGISNYQTFATLLLWRAYDYATVGLSSSMTKAQLEEHSRKMNNQISEVTQILKTLPREALVILRNNNLVRSINQDLGIPVNRFVIMARSALRGLSNFEDYENSWSGKILWLIRRLDFEFKLKIAEWISILMDWWAHVAYALGVAGKPIQITDDEINFA